MILAGLKLLKAVDNTKSFSETGDIKKVGEALDNINRYFKTLGIITIVVIALYIVVLIVIAIAGISLFPTFPKTY